jgi:hypothetical protein
MVRKLCGAEALRRRKSAPPKISTADRWEGRRKAQAVHRSLRHKYYVRPPPYRRLTKPEKGIKTRIAKAVPPLYIAANSD